VFVATSIYGRYVQSFTLNMSSCLHGKLEDLNSRRRLKYTRALWATMTTLSLLKRLMDELTVLCAETHDTKIRDVKAGGITSYETF
jgi:hypothetical protein